MLDHLRLGGLLDLGLESNGFACDRFLRHAKYAHLMKSYLPHKLNHLHSVKILFLKHGVDDVVFRLEEKHENLLIYHPLSILET
jgi:hypothetical protein